jgi:hypothetical protein
VPSFSGEPREFSIADIVLLEKYRGAVPDHIKTYFLKTILNGEGGKENWVRTWKRLVACVDGKKPCSWKS